MPRALQIIVTRSFAGAERYVSTLAAALPGAGWDVTVVGGSPDAMPSSLDGSGVAWLPGGSPHEAVRAVAGAGRFDVCHVHMTYAEAVGLALRGRHRAPVVATRHFAARRGASAVGRLLAGPIGRGLAAEIAISEFVASHLDRRPIRVVVNGVAGRPLGWQPDNRVVLVLQRLEPEKDTLTAVRGWHRSGLAARGWRLRLVGAGAQRSALEEHVRREGVAGVEFVGWVADVQAELSGAGMLLATAPAEPLGLSVLEGLAAGVPVVAAASGGHLETAATVPGATLFTPGDVDGVADVLRRLAEDDGLRATLSSASRATHAQRFGLDRHVQQVVEVYDTLRRPAGSSSRLGSGAR